VQPPLQFTSWAVSVVAPPSPVLGTDGRRHLVYEMTVANAAAHTTLVSVEVRDGRSGRLIDRISPSRSPNFMSSQASAGPIRSLGPSEGGLPWFDVALPRNASIPHTLMHTITIRVTAAGRTPVIKHMADMGRSSVDLRPPIKLSSPLQPGTYVNGNGCCTKSAHDRALLTIDGDRYLSQRYAIDWGIAGRDGRTYAGDPTKNTSFFVYGKVTVAAANGVVADTNDGLPDNTPPNPPSNLERLTTRTALGNFVALNAGGGHFLVYCHLQPGSLRVRKGQRVRAGDPIGLVGNSGSSTQPHLHFMVTAGPQPIAANGRPWVFRFWRFAGRVTNLAGFSDGQPARIVTAPSPARRHDELPLQGALVSFSRP
jgi:Peptidase family M23